jgi:hypothetical protein
MEFLSKKIKNNFIKSYFVTLFYYNTCIKHNKELKMVYMNSKHILLNDEGYLWKSTGKFIPADSIYEVELIQAPTYKARSIPFFLFAWFIFNTQGISRGVGISNGFAIGVAVFLIIIGFLFLIYYRAQIILKDKSGKKLSTINVDSTAPYECFKKFLKNKEKQQRS